MLKKSITYTNFDDQEVTEDFYFNLTKLELMEQDLDGTLEERIKKLVATENGPEVYRLFKSIVMSSYGVRSDDGKRFYKTEEARAEFEASPALSELVFEMLQSPEKGAEFIKGILPTDMRGAAAEAFTGEVVTQDAPATPPARTWDSFTEEELMSLPKDEFNKLLGSGAGKNLTPEKLQIAMRRASQGPQ